MNTMFDFATAFNQNIGGWNVASVSDMNSAFASAVSFNYNLAAWNVVRVVDLTGSFDSTTALDDCYKRGVYETWGSTMEAAYPAWSSLCTPTILQTSPANVASTFASFVSITGVSFGDSGDLTPSSYMSGAITR